MKFVSIRDFRSKTAAVRKDLEREKEIVLTVSGRPFAILSHVNPDQLEEELMALRRARAQKALDRIRAESQRKGIDRTSMEEIDRLITKVRRERRSRVKPAR